MKRLKIILIIIMVVFSIPATANARSGEPILVQNDIPDYNNVLQENSSINKFMSVTTDAPVDEDTYREEQTNNDIPHPQLSDGIAGRGDIKTPDKYWSEKGYPTDISFAYEAGGEVLPDGTVVSFWEIGVVNVDEKRKQEIIDMLSPDCLITFIDCKYSFNHRKAVYDEIRASGDGNFQAVVMSRNTEKILVKVSEKYLDEYAAKFEKQYGSLVVATNDLNASKEDSILSGGGINQSNSLWYGPIFAIVFITAAAILLLYRYHFIPTMQTTRGTVVTQSKPVSKKEIIVAVKNSEITPNNEVFDLILNDIDKMY